MFFSIIIPVYNVEQYLAECFESLLDQKNQNFEVICINDGSSDNSIKVIEEYSTKFNNFTFKSIANSGISVARNTGLSLCRGDFILYLDGDDKLHVDALKLCAEQIETHQADIVMFEAKSFVDGVEESQTNICNYDRPVFYHQPITGYEFFIESWRQEKYFVSACCYCYRKSKYKNLRFADGILHEDNLFTTQLLIAAKSDQIICINNKLFLRRYRPGSTTTQAKSQRHVQGLLHCANRIANIVTNMTETETIKPALAKFCRSIFDQVIATDKRVPNRRQRLTESQKWHIFLTYRKIPNIGWKAQILFWWPWLIKFKTRILANREV
ncbi:glycosyltransferase family 2 protein [Vibrio alfacsensis]|uniref:glycosyltransferase family 2 protein n=1 Tax=Vibrio alfacsensis TaxID=1074311 RepID=UPI004068311B